MASPIAITGSYFFNDFELTSSYARVTHMELPFSAQDLRGGNTPSVTGSYEVDVFYNSESFALYKEGDPSVSVVEGHMFRYCFKYDEGDTDFVNQVYNNLIASQSAFASMSQKIFS